MMKSMVTMKMTKKVVMWVCERIAMVMTAHSPQMMVLVMVEKFGWENEMHGVDGAMMRGCCAC